MRNLAIAVVTMVSAMAWSAAPDKAAAAADKTGPARWGKGDKGEHRAERMQEREQKARMMAVVGIAEALELSEADALKLGDKLRTFDERRRPIREQMGESMKALKAASEGDEGAMKQVDQALQQVLDGRAQMAVLDKEMFTALAQGQPAQKKAKLALFLARFGQEMQRLRAMGMHERGGGERD